VADVDHLLCGEFRDGVERCAFRILGRDIGDIWSGRDLKLAGVFADCDRRDCGVDGGYGRNGEHDLPR
jgi:hypothetical protein